MLVCDTAACRHRLRRHPASAGLRAVALLVLSAAVVAGAADPATAAQVPRLPGKEHVRVFLLAGQSNMSGRGLPLAAEDTTAHPRIFAVDKADAIVPAVEPLHSDRGNRNGVGPGFAFARALIDRLPAQDVILLVPTAVGGTSLNEWQPGQAKNSRYPELLRRTRIALGHGTMAGVLWHQGENGPGPESYPRAFAAFASGLRTDLGTTELPIILGTICENEKNAPMNDMLRALPNAIPRSRTCDFKDICVGGVHFSPAVYREMGRRYAEAWAAMSGVAAK